MKLIITHEFDPYQDQEEIEILHNAMRNHCIIEDIKNELRKLRKYGDETDSQFGARAEDIIYQIINDNE